MPGLGPGKGAGSKAPGGKEPSGLERNFTERGKPLQLTEAPWIEQALPGPEARAPLPKGPESGEIWKRR